MRSLLGAVVLMALLPLGPAEAQEATGHVQGRVFLGEAEPAASVRVSASGPSLQASREAETDARGYFRLNDLPVGTYQVRLALLGYRPVRIDSVTVRLGRTTSLAPTHLDLQALELGEIVVNAARPLVDVASAATVTNFASGQFDALPIDRNFRSIVSLAPLANTSQFPGEEANIAGSTGPENAYYVDGVNITDPKLAATSADLPYNFVRELQVKAAGYEAEFGRATGGIVDVVTHSGGNRFGGQVFGFFTNRSLTAEPHFALEGARQSRFSDYDVGGTLGGPILRDRLWFFAAYDPSVHEEQVDVRGPEVPDDHSTEHRFASKLTWRPGPNTDLAVTAHGDPERHRTVDLGLVVDSVADLEAVTAKGHSGGLVLSALLRHRLGQAVQVELGVGRFTFNGFGEDALGRTDPHFADHTTGVVSGGYGHRAHDNRRRASAGGSLAIAVGRHAMKVGVAYEDNRVEQGLDGTGDPGSPQGFIDRLDDTTYEWTRLRITGLAHNRVLSAYGQDSWRLGDRLTLNYGLRWDLEYLIRPDGKLGQRFTDQPQPRVGFTYQPGVAGSQKVFGSYARYYEQFPLLVALVYYNSPTNDPGRAVVLRYNHDPRVDRSGADTVFDSARFSSDPLPERDLEGQSLDEFTLGYERALGRALTVGLTGISRGQRWAVEDAVNPETGRYEVGNPGRGDLTFIPRARHTYRALVLEVAKPRGRRFRFLASYTLSRSWGNYDGLGMQGFSPNVQVTFDVPVTSTNSTGLVANDKPHVLKFSGSYQFDFGLTVGTAIAWANGEPRNQLGELPDLGGLYPVFLQPRGSAGRTSSVFDANLRLVYALRPWGSAALVPKLYLDLFHIGNQRTALHFDELKYLDGDPTQPNPFYGRPLLFQPPMSARVGLSLDFGALD